MEHGQRSEPGHQAQRDASPHPAFPPPISESVPSQGGPAYDAVEPARVIEILSHELRSPITTIHLGTKVLRDAGNHISGPVRTEVVEAVEEEAERLYRLVEDLLAVARHEGGAAPLPVAPLAIQRWLPDTIAAEVRAYPALVVRSSIPHDLPPVLVDDGGFAHVVRNLLANAVRYAPRGMPVEIVGGVSEPGVVRLEFLDRGPGVDAAEAERLFDPFYRSQSATLQGSGAGLGLAAARRLLGAMNATIEALPREGGGARFIITLPVAPADAEPEPDRPSAR
jgi:K+-sensing histidine kinase KdpD